MIDGTAEQDRVVCRSPGFVSAMDFKWDGKTFGGFYIIAVAIDPSMRTLRDIRGCHSAILTELRSTVYSTVSAKWPDLDLSQLAVFAHYLPSFCRLHFHFVPAYSPLYTYRCAESTTLDSIIDNINLNPDYTSCVH